MFENKIIRDIFASQFIMSWIRSGGTLKPRRRRGEYGDYNHFITWLETLGLNDEEIRYITSLACGKLELELSAKEYRTRNDLPI